MRSEQILFILFTSSFLFNVCLVYLLFKHKTITKVTPPKKDFSEIMNDFDTHGYSILRISPDNVFYRKR